MNRLIKSLMLFIIVTASVGSVGLAYGEFASTPQDDGIIVIIIAVSVGSVAAPWYAWATSKPGADGKQEKLNWPQYSRAIGITFIGNLALLVAEIEFFSIEVLTLQATIVLFIGAFIQALGINAAKAGAVHSNKK